MKEIHHVRLAFASICVFVFLFFNVHVISAQNYIPRDFILLNCGGPSTANDMDGRKWMTDDKSKFLPATGNSTTSRAATQVPSVLETPFMTARVFHSNFTYTFPVAPTRLFLRLYFYPSSYGGLDASDARFSVSAQTYTLLNNFSASQTAEALYSATIVKEYSINVENGRLSLTFTPSPTHPKAYAFVNGIEIVSMPDIYSETSGTVLIVGQSSPFTVDNTTALENIHRLNVGGNYISPSADTGMHRPWFDDSPYLFAAAKGVTTITDQNTRISYPPSISTYVAPVDVYSTARTMGPDNNVNLNYNLTWVFSVDSGFFYLVRLHFCEIAAGITKVNQRVFDIFIFNQTATLGVDVIESAGSNYAAVFKDYVVMVPSYGDPQKDLWLQLHPHKSSRPNYYDSILNGVEIFKINNSDANLAGPNPVPAAKQEIIDPSLAIPGSSHGKSKNRMAIIAGVVCGAVVLGLIIGFFVVAAKRRRGMDCISVTGQSGWLTLSVYGNSPLAEINATGSYASSLLSNCRHFSFAEIKAATREFDESLVLGVGGFGKVYKGEIDGGTRKVAIKRGNPLSEQGVHEFQTEIEMLSKLRHRHLVSLIGYCEENCEMILVYDYMSRGTLREHLYKTHNPPLSWKQRLEICIGAARGLHYLHTGAKHTIIHRDVKTTNILLDEKWVAKVSDFGLSKTGPTMDHTHVSTVVKGSFGYLDPEYFRRQQLTEKSDVYSFGVVLFEVLCARPALNPTLPKEEVSLAEWAAHCYIKGVLDQIIDTFLKGKIASECLKKFAETAMKCVSDQGIDRPSIGDVLWNLEFALQLQESAEESGEVGSGMEVKGQLDVAYKGKMDPDASPGMDGNITDSRSTGISMSIGGRSLASEDSYGLTPSTVFSQILNPKGR
ncbi:receptor-like protein kinase FERONIA isoform X1 [Cucurbita moschata]|uniref:non-specific serine/threonine protein kinase n=2 Tax=Cucurbita moschata TaxID=3662 RepID=A0A6J1EDV8_CUCMO|nr:receptor-like protein kinase FERONIA isoform X1 [Cucurbita moschata]